MANIYGKMKTHKSVKPQGVRGGIPSSPYQVKPKPVAKPIKANTGMDRIQRLAMSNPPSKGTIWQGPPSTNERLNENARKWVSKDSTTKSGFAKNNAAANKIASGPTKVQKLIANTPSYAKNYMMLRSPVDVMMGGYLMSENYQDQLMKSGPRDRAALAYQSNTLADGGTSLPEARRQYDNMQQSFLSGGATHYNWDQFNPDLAFGPLGGYNGN